MFTGCFGNWTTFSDFIVKTFAVIFSIQAHKTHAIFKMSGLICSIIRYAINRLHFETRRLFAADFAQFGKLQVAITIGRVDIIPLRPIMSSTATSLLTLTYEF